MNPFKEKRLCHMAFILERGMEEVWRAQPTTASTAIEDGAAMKLSSGVVAHMTTGTKLYGFARKAKAVGDASTDPVPIAVAKRGQEYRAPVNTGTYATTSPGGSADVDYAGSQPGKVDLSASNNDLVVVGGDVTLQEAVVVCINTVY